MRDYLPDELPPEPEPLEWDVEPWWWDELMTMPLEGDQPGARREERRNETDIVYHVVSE